MEQILDNYRNLIARVNELCTDIEQALQGQITCSEGCSACCASITIFPVEAAALREQLTKLPVEEAEAIRRYVAQHATGVCCPLLSNQRCLLYEARPIICRTHGLPILFTEDNQQRLDCCPLNLTSSESLSGSHIVDLDRLNVVLVAVNALFLKQTQAPSDLPERQSIAEALLRQE
ncbi:MAG: YkgJ family cysteine cluster protein [Desulfuromonadales bacterium]|nr:YkgJ family cysteine cluster protein [Desulfuromonadales bacterium]